MQLTACTSTTSVILMGSTAIATAAENDSRPTAASRWANGRATVTTARGATSIALGAAQITRVVEAVSREAKRVRPGIKISAAVFGAYPSCRQAVGQDWVAWVKAGYLDFLCPMDYTAGDDTFADLVSSQMYFVGGRVPIYAGIGATAVTPPMTASQVIVQIEKGRALGASGFSIFNLDGKTIETLVPEIGIGLKAARGNP